MVDRDNAISQHELDKKTLRNTIQRNQEAANVREKLLQEKLDAMKSELANATDQLDACTNQLAAAHSKQKQLTSQPGAPILRFYHQRGGRLPCTSKQRPYRATEVGVHKVVRDGWNT
jgi:hypothetical protein